ncbi:hypothetical protein KAS79_02190 [Candidatus Parcubacteria bacterium]|nr:hypothetical protein [Candidatus Parcubacteria bacterium]
MKKVYFVFIFTFIFLGFCGFAFAEEDLLSDVNFPIPELGNCVSMEECEAYCDLEENTKACLDFAEAHNLLSQEEIEKDRKMLEMLETMAGPGGCQGQEECEIYCDEPEHMEECIIFGKEHNLIPPEELAQAEQALIAIKKGVKPPPCRGKQECDIYCSQIEHLEECITFGEAAGFMSSEEAGMIRKTGGKGPGGCQGKEECDAYCNNPDHMKECIEFGLKYGLMPAEEEKEARMMLQALEKGIKPPMCGNKQECDIYCSQPEHMEECVNFGEAAGFMSSEEAEQVRKMAKAGIFGGPGGCQGKEECEAYCNNPDNMQECMEFAVKAGFMSSEEAEETKKIGEQFGPGGPGGPGGCQTPEECDAYCQDPEHMQECMEFGQKMGLVKPEEVEMVKKIGPEGPGGPGGCQTPEECKAYCDNPEHMEECFNFSVKEGMMSSEDAEKMKQMMTPPEGYIEMTPPEGYIEMTPPEGYIEMTPPEQGMMMPQKEFAPMQEPQSEEAAPFFEEPQTFFETIKQFLASVATALEISF